MMSNRRVERIVHGQSTSDGAGVRLYRVIGSNALPDLDPFLLLDEFRSDQPGDYIAGFPNHPHRGFETVTYILAGRMRHRDNQGNSGLLEAGSVQWMTAGRGIVHSEMPEQADGLMWGFQLWVNLPARDKMMPPRYQDIPPAEIPEATPSPGVHVRVVAGSFGDKTGAVRGISTDPMYLDVRLAQSTRIELPVPADHHAFIYVYSGSCQIAGTPVERGSLAVLSPGSQVDVVHVEGDARFLLVAGRPLGEPVARYGPFVMNTRDEILKAFEDFNSGRF